MEPSNTIAILILAAGESARMVEPKQLLPWKDGTLLGNAIKIAKASRANDVFVILGANSKDIRPTIMEGEIVVVNNPDWKNGLGSSISRGIEHLIESDTSYSRVLIMLCDQPFISSAYLNKLIHAFRRGKKGIVATDYGNRAGVPAIFDLKYFSKLTELDHDFGAKEVLQKYQKDCVMLSAEGLIADIDTPEDYQKFK